MNPSYAIIDVEFIHPVESLYPGWDVWEADVTLESGDVVHGTIQGDGLMSYDQQSFEPDDDDS